MRERVTRTVVVVVVSLLASVTFAKDAEVDRVKATLAAWEQFWTSYDLNQIEHLFVQDQELTYFSSEKTDLIKGVKTMVPHHRDFGFAEGGASHSNKLWLEDTHIEKIRDGAYLVAAIWRFRIGDGPDARLQRGPVTFILVREGETYKIFHANFATYENGSEE